MSDETQVSQPTRVSTRAAALALTTTLALISGMLLLGSVVLASSTGEAANINQCRNGAPSAHVACIASTGAWQNGNLGGSNSHYRENDSVPFQVLLTGMGGSNAGLHTLDINWAETASSKHAYDYLTSFNRTETNADACAGFLGFTTSTCLSNHTTITIGADPNLAACSGFSGTQVPGVIDVYGATGNSLVYFNTPTSCQGSANTGFAHVNFTTSASQNSVILAWGGHVASQIDWGLGNSASAISGSPYHMALGTLDLASTGSQDRSIKAAAILPVPTIVTQVSSATTAVGTSITDLATLTGSNGTVTGTVQFFYCGPQATTSTACTFGTGGTATSFGTAKTLGTPAAGQATSDSFPGTTGVSPSAGQIYCFAIRYTPDAAANYSPGQSTSTTNECVTFTSNGTGTQTTPTHSTIVLGNTIQDNATVTGNANGGSPTGTVDFWLCSPAQMTALNETTCAAGGTPDANNSFSLTAGANNTATAGPSTAATPNATGTWCYRAVYNPATGSSYTTSSDSSTGECFAVTPADTTTVTTPSGNATVGATNVTDTAVVTGNAAGGSPTGNVDFFLCSPAQMLALSETTCATGGTPDPNNHIGLTAGANNTASATSTAFTVNAAGTWCFRAVYNGDSNYNGSHDSSAGECFTVGPAGPRNTTAQSLIPDDSMTLTGGFSPTGTIDFYLFAPGVNLACATTPTALALAAFHQQVTVSGNATYSTTNHLQASPYTATAVGTYHWLAIYSGDGNNSGTSSSCTETFNITN